MTAVQRLGVRLAIGAGATAAAMSVASAAALGSVDPAGLVTQLSHELAARQHVAVPPDGCAASGGRMASGAGSAGRMASGTGSSSRVASGVGSGAREASCSR